VKTSLILKKIQGEGIASLYFNSIRIKIIKRSDICAILARFTA